MVEKLKVGSVHVPVLFPEVLEFTLRGVLAAGQLQRDLHAVGEQIVEVLGSVTCCKELCLPRGGHR